ncbi:MAG: guanylate cyclase [Polaromonas sp.]|nr:guanylate cyclase [Polaromonas sp.]
MKPLALPALDEPLAQFRSAFDAGGLAGALHFLNARTSYRYTAIYRLEGQMMRNIELYDRLGEQSAALSEVPLGDSFCQFVMNQNGFATPNSADDRRLDGHPYQGVLNAYFGLPLSRGPGTIYGTFCHFDFEPRNLEDSEICLLEAVAPVLMDRLP